MDIPSTPLALSVLQHEAIEPLEEYVYFSDV